MAEVKISQRSSQNKNHFLNVPEQLKIVISHTHEAFLCRNYINESSRIKGMSQVIKLSNPNALRGCGKSNLPLK